MLAMIVRLMALLGLALAAVHLSRGSVVRVPEDASTIQSAFDSIAAGDTILVSLGTYAEALTSPPFRFTLKGDVIPDPSEYPRPVVDLSSVSGGDTLYCLTLPVGGCCVVEDMVFRHGRMGIRCRADSVTLRACILDSSGWGFYTVYLGTDDVELRFENCIVRDHTMLGIYIIDHAVVVQNCTFPSGLQGYSRCSIGAGSRVSNCIFGGNPGGRVLQVWGSDAIVEECTFSSAPETSNSLLRLAQNESLVTVRNNLFINSSVVDAALSITPETAQAFLIQNNTFLNVHATSDTGSGGVRAAPNYPIYQPYGGRIQGNSFVDCYGGGNGANAIDMRNSDATIDENRFVESAPDPWFRPTVHLSSSEASLMQNNLIDGTGYGLEFSDGPTLNAEWNWWGDASGPYHAQMNPGGQGDTIVGAVDFEPWYADTSFLSIPGIGAPLPKEFVFDAYPNPFNSTVRLKLIPADVQIVKVELFDLLGRKVDEIWRGPLAFQQEIEFDAAELASGIYFARVTDVISRKQMGMKKLVLMK